MGGLSVPTDWIERTYELLTLPLRIFYRARDSNGIQVGYVRMRVCVGSSVLFSDIPVTSTDGSQASPTTNSQPSIERLQARRIECNYRAASVPYVNGPDGNRGALPDPLCAAGHRLRRSERRTSLVVS